MDIEPIPSLLDPESTGGDTAEGGFSFQEGVLLAHVPRWLAQEGFDSLIREAYGDAEARFFVPGGGYTKEFLEVKNHPIAPAEFWSELERFQKMDRASPSTYRWFTLACPGISDRLKPLCNGLRRVRDPYGFYDGDTALQEQSYRDYERILLELGRTAGDALFLFHKVLIQDDYSLAGSSAEALFRQGLVTYLPEYDDLSQKSITSVFACVSTFLKGRLRAPVTRPELEGKLRERIPPAQLPPPRPVRAVTAAGEASSLSALRLDWDAYFGGRDRAYPAPEQWNTELLTQLLEARNWINRNRLGRRVCLEGCRRLSAAFAIGSVFSAVAGYTVEMNHRGVWWSTDPPTSADAAHYRLEITSPHGIGERLVVVLDVLRNIRESVETNLPALGLEGMPLLHLHGETPVTSAAQANRIVAEVKATVTANVLRCRARAIDLFYAGPSHLALFLGHRMNAMGPVQCYEWTPPATYVPTCRLNA